MAAHRVSQTENRRIWQPLTPAILPILLAPGACSGPMPPPVVTTPPVSAVPVPTEAVESTTPAAAPIETLELAAPDPEQIRTVTATTSPTPKQAPQPTFTPVPTVTATVQPAATAMPQPTSPSTTEAAATPVPSPTIAATPTPVPVLATGGRDNAITTRDGEYDYVIELLEGWSLDGEGIYSGRAPSGSLTLASQYLPQGYTLEQFTRLVLYDLRRDWWPTASFFEIVSVEETMVGGQPAVRIRYRVQESAGYCRIDVAELVTVSELLPGNTQGFRAMA